MYKFDKNQYNVNEGWHQNNLKIYIWHSSTAR